MFPDGPFSVTGHIYYIEIKGVAFIYFLDKSYFI